MTADRVRKSDEGRCEHERTRVDSRTPMREWPGCRVCGIPRGAGRYAERQRREGNPLYQLYVPFGSANEVRLLRSVVRELVLQAAREGGIRLGVRDLDLLPNEAEAFERAMTEEHDHG